MLFGEKIKNVLVTSAGGDLGIAICRILIDTGEFNAIVGADISSDNAATVYCDKFFQVPKFYDHNYLDTLRNIIEQEDIDVIIPASEEEIRGWASTKTKFSGKFAGAIVIIADHLALDIGLDKLKTVSFLQEHDMPYPWSVDANLGEPLSFPCILKSRSGSGSSCVNIVKQDDYKIFKEKLQRDYIWQELIIGDDQEYTCGLYRTKTGNIRSIVFRRKLVAGWTASGVVVDDPRINELLINIADKLQLQGSINVQLRKNKDIPIVFEINPRFSSTVRFRHLLGFKDLVWSIQDAIAIEPELYIAPKTGTRIYRMSEELVL